MSGAITPFPQYVFMAWCSVKKSTHTSLLLLYLCVMKLQATQLTNSVDQVLEKLPVT